MKAPKFDYVAATSVAEALDGVSVEDAKLLAGGQSFLPVLAMRMAHPSVVVDINGLTDLKGIEADSSRVRVGALVRHHELAEQTVHPMLAHAAGHIGHTAIRTRGTCGGSIAHADPVAELPAIAVLLDAWMTVQSKQGVREVAASDFFVSALMSDLADDELLTSITFHKPRRWGFAEIARRHGDFAIAMAAVAEYDDQVRIVVGGVASTPVRATQAETAYSSGGIDAAVAALAEEIHPSSDIHGSADYRRHVAVEMMRRGLTQLQEQEPPA